MIWDIIKRSSKRARIAALAVLMIPMILYCCGCTTTRWERTDELGATLRGRQDTFLAKADKSAIDAMASGKPDGAYEIAIGSTAEGADSTEALAALQALLELARMLGPLFVPATQPAPAEPQAQIVPLPIP